jgi:hypothetical protein
MERIDDESIWLGSPSFAYELEWREAPGYLERATEIVRVDEVLASLIVRFMR